MLSLPAEYDEMDMEKYYLFVNEFGTHYVKQGTLGARYGEFILTNNVLKSRT